MTWSAAPAGPAPDLLGLSARLACVLALLGLVLWIVRRTGGRTRRAAPLQVLSTTRLGKSATLSIVRVHDEEYVLGVTGSAVTLLSSRASTPDSGGPAPAQAAPAPAAVPGPAAPPTPAEFLLHAWRVVRRRPVESTELPADEVEAAVVGALAGALPAQGTGTSAGGDAGSTTFSDQLDAALKRTRGPVESTASTAPGSADGSAPLPRRQTSRRSRSRTDALPRKEHPAWTAHRRARRLPAADGAQV